MDQAPRRPANPPEQRAEEASARRHVGPANESGGSPPSRAWKISLSAIVAASVLGLVAMFWSPPSDGNGQTESMDPSSDEFAQARSRMIEHDLRSRDIRREDILRAMGQVPRHRFVPEDLRRQAYADHPLPIGAGQTISQPYIVALMTQLVEPGAESVALDIGTGSGYQAAVLAELCREVYSIEIVPSLAESATERLKQLGYENVTVRQGDGYQGWPEKGPFDVIVVAAAPDHVPQPLVDQLAPGGRLVIPVGDRYQQLLLITRDAEGRVHRKTVAPVAFVPMTGEAGASRDGSDQR